MIIKQGRVPPSLLTWSLWRLLAAFRRSRRLVWVGVFLAFTGLAGAAGFLAGVIAHDSDTFGQVLDRMLIDTPLVRAVSQPLKPLASMAMGAVQEGFDIPGNYARGLWADPDRIFIDIGFEHVEKLAYQREQALQARVLVQGDDDWVPARIRFRDEDLPVRLRLKGDNIDHLHGDKWSYRVKVRGEGTLWGMKVFSLQHPKTRNFVYEWIYHRALAREGVLALRYRFVQVVVNGEDRGVLAVEEHFDKRLLEHAGRKEGPILKFNEDVAWRTGSIYQDPGWAYRTSSLDTFQTTKMLTTPTLEAAHVKATSLLESLRNGHLRTSEVFDVEALAAYYVVSELLGATHAHEFHNIRFYYDPIRSLLEPIGYDGNAGHADHHLRQRIWNPLSHSRDSGSAVVRSLEEEFFSDPVFYRSYLAKLEALSKPEYLEELLADLGPELEKNLAILYRDYPWMHYSPDVFTQNQRGMREALNPVRAFNAHVRGSRGALVELDIGSVVHLPIRVEALVIGTDAGEEKGQDIVLIARGDEVLLPLSGGQSPVRYQRYGFEAPAGFEWKNGLLPRARLRFRFAGTRTTRTEVVLPGPLVEDDFVLTDFMRLPSNVESFDVVTRLEGSPPELHFPTGTVTLDRNMILPPGHLVRFPPGLHLRCVAGAKVVSRSPILASGTRENPIVFESPDGSGQGLFVLDTQRESVLRHVSFRGLSPPREGRWELTGAVTFFQAPVRLEHCEFSDARAEDALNLVRTTFTISDTVFSGSLSDALDSDFSIGELTATTFLRSGNDAVDLSGSELRMESVTIVGFGDKGISVGEESRLSARNVTIENGPVAIASKDRSFVEIEELRVVGARVGLAVFQKKSEFGGATIEVSRIIFEDVATPHLVEQGSAASIDGRELPATAALVGELLGASGDGTSGGD